MNSKRLVVGLSLLLSGAAAAQEYVATPAVAAYPALTSPSPVVLAGFTPADNGRVSVPLGFAFPYFGKTYSEVIVTANGMAFLEPTSCTTCDYPGNTPFPSGNLPNGVLAPLWDDLKGGNPFSRLQAQAVTGTNGQGLAIEWSNWNNWWSNSTYSLTFQLRLWANGIIEFFYGPLTGTGSVLSAGAGIEDPTGTIGVPAKPCANQPYAYCTFSDFTPGQSITFGPPALADLLVSSLTVGQIVQPGADLEISTDLTMRNWGWAAATGFIYRLYLSANTTFEPALDVPMTPAAQGPLSIPGLGLLSHHAVSTVPRPSSGSVYVIAVLDDGNVIAESNELNNVGATPTPLFAGVDLVALSITGPLSSGPGEPVVNHLSFTNQGFDSAGPVGFKIWLSADATLDAGDRLVKSGTVNVAGGQTISQDVAYSLPLNIPSGDYWFVLQLDDGPAAGAIAELSKTNNVVFSAARFTSRQGDLAAGPVEVRDPQPPNDLAARAYFGEDCRLEATLSNLGGATAVGFSAVFYLSDNATLNGLSDPEIGSVTGLSLAPGATTRVVLTRPLPTRSMAGALLVPGNYYVFVSAVPGAGFVEVNSANNINVSPAQPVRAPAADLLATALQGPALAGAGELVAVTRTLRNAGNRPATAARYRFVLSANAIVTEDDRVLPIQTATGPVDEGTVSLAVGADDLATELVRVPADLPAASYYLGVLVNPAGPGQLDESDFSNNGLSTQAVEVVPAAFHLVSPGVPDAMVGRPYCLQLAAAGARGPYQFALVAGLGELPAGLALSADGRISGTPTAPGLAAFSVAVTAGGQVTRARLVVRVVEFSSELTLVTRELPALPSQAAYEFFFSATGGTAPYRWEVDSGALPAGLVLSEEGRLFGAATDPVGTDADFIVRVRDASGDTAARALRMTVLFPGALYVATRELPVARLGSDYLADVVARLADGSAVDRPVSWQVLSGPLPSGLSLSAVDEVALLEGTPRVSGNFPITLSVRDAQGRVDLASFMLTVAGSAVSMSTDLPPQLVRGQEVASSLHLADGQPARFALFGGRLPSGLVLSPSGELRGTVDADAALQRYDFAVSATAADGAYALGAFSTEVAIPAEPSPAASCGCSVAAELPPLIAWSLIVLVVSRRCRH